MCLLLWVCFAVGKAWCLRTELAKFVAMRAARPPLSSMLDTTRKRLQDESDPEFQSVMKPFMTLLSLAVLIFVSFSKEVLARYNGPTEPLPPIVLRIGRWKLNVKPEMMNFKGFHVTSTL